MADADRVRQFEIIGRHRSPFQGIGEWPWLDDLLLKESGDLKERVSFDEWERETGGEHDFQGRPYCKLSSPLATRAVKNIAVTHGGLLWLDSHGEAWAVRLARAAQVASEALFGFCVSWGGNPLLLDAQSRSSVRDDLQRAAKDLRLFSRAEQLLWLIHASVLQQRSSTVVLPDALMGEVVWGGRRDQWPPNWRADLVATLRSLTYLRSEVIKLDRNGWQPRLGAFSVGVASFEDLSVMRPHEDRCGRLCPLYDSAAPHRHFLVQIGTGFLGVLEKFLAKREDGERSYNFRDTPGGDRGEELMQVQKKGQIVPVNLLSKLFGPAKWSGLTHSQQATLNEVLREVTRGRHSQRADRADVFKGQMVIGTKPRSTLPCPFLNQKGEYVVFGGNGRRRGQGYRVFGNQGHGWLHKCGYSDGDDGGELLIVQARRFLADLDALASSLGLIIAAVHPRSNQWYGLPELRDVARQRSSWALLDDVHLRVYAPSRYLDDLRAYFERQGGFSMSQAHRQRTEGKLPPPKPLSLKVRLQRLRINHQQMADALGVTRPFVTALLNGTKRWPAGVEARVIELVEARERAACA